MQLVCVWLTHPRSSCVPPQVESGEEVAAVTTAEQREAFLAQLTEAEDWLYGEGEAVEASEYRYAWLGLSVGGGWVEWGWVRCRVAWQVMRAWPLWQLSSHTVARFIGHLTTSHPPPRLPLPAAPACASCVKWATILPLACLRRQTAPPW